VRRIEGHVGGRKRGGERGGEFRTHQEKAMLLEVKGRTTGRGRASIGLERRDHLLRMCGGV